MTPELVDVTVRMDEDTAQWFVNEWFARFTDHMTESEHMSLRSYEFVSDGKDD